MTVRRLNTIGIGISDLRNYKHEALPDERATIRVLILHPGRRIHALSGSLQIVQFPPQHGMTYEAISYRWGDRDSPKQMILDGRRYEITRNLHAALRRFRRKKESRCLWVDAICINQNNDKEKGHQIQLMKRVYQYSSNMLAWIGTGSSFRVHRGFSSAPKIIEFAKDKAPGPDDPGIDWRSIYLRVRTSNFRTIWTLPYFSRIWIVQELAVSPVVQVWYGKSFVSLEVLIRAFEVMVSHDVLTVREKKAFEPTMAIFRRRAEIQQKVEGNLLQILTEHRNTSATTPKDKIYALLGLAAPDDLANDSIEPDYSTSYSVEQSYLDFAAWVLCRSKNLDLLSAAGISRSRTTNPNASLPSWVPDWRNPAGSSPLLWTKRGQWFTSTFGGSISPEWSEEGKILKLRGCILDEIKEIGSILHRPQSQQQTRQNLLLVSDWNDVNKLSARFRKWRYWTGFFAPQGLVDHVESKNVFPTTNMGPLYTSVHASESQCPLTRREQRSLIGGYPGSPQTILPTSHIWLPFEVLQRAQDLFEASTHRKGEKNYESYAFHATFNRRMFMTNSDRLGLGSRLCQPGDQIALLEGGKVPFVLRRKGEAYELVGECYIHGFKEAGAFDASQSTDIWLV